MTHIQILALLLLPIPIALLAFYLVERFWPNAPRRIAKWSIFLLLYLPFGFAMPYFIWNVGHWAILARII